MVRRDTNCDPHTSQNAMLSNPNDYYFITANNLTTNNQRELNILKLRIYDYHGNTSMT